MREAVALPMPLTAPLAKNRSIPSTELGLSGW